MKKATNAAKPKLKSAFPVVFVSNVEASAGYFRDKLGFQVDFLYGEPPFYGSVSRGGARMHLRFVHEPVITPETRKREEDLLSAYIEVDKIQSLYEEFKKAGVNVAQQLKNEPWGAFSFIVLDPDGNYIYFAGREVGA